MINHENLLLHFPETSPAQESPENRWIRTRKLEAGAGYEAEFRLHCRGIFREDRFAEQKKTTTWAQRQDRILRALLAVMGPDASIEFQFRGGGGTSLSWDIGGLAQATTEGMARHKAAGLFPSFKAMTGTFDEQYRFEPLLRESDIEDPAFSFSELLQVETTTLSVDDRKGALGFAATEPSAPALPRIVVAPLHRPRDFAFPSVAAAVAASSVPVCFSIELTPFSLTNAQTERVREARDQLVAQGSRRNGSAPETVAPGWSLAACRSALDLWLASALGYRVRARLTSATPIPSPMRHLIANDLFPNNTGEAQTSQTLPSVEGTDDIDLINCIPVRGRLPVLFPDRKTLERQQTKKAYNQRKPKLTTTGVRLGRIDETGLQMPVHSDPAWRNRHTYIIGATGTGKSTLLLNMIQQDVRGGEGVCLIDPHGDLYEDVLRSIPASRKDDVVLLNPCETDSVPGINFLEATSETTRTLEVNHAVNELVKMLSRLYNMREAGGPMFETYFRNALLLLVDSEISGHTLAELSAVFEDKKFRDVLKEKCLNRYVVNFWQRQAEKAGGEASLSNVAPYITSKLNLLVQSALLRPIIGQSRTTIDFRTVMDKRRILLVNLSKGQLGELDTQLLGMLIIGKLFSSAMSRGTVPQRDRIPFHLYVDEFQNFMTDSIAHLLSEARKFGLCLTLANQNLSQLHTNEGRQNLLDAVLGNVGSFILFRLGSPDAAKMELYTRPHFNYEDLQNLPNFHALARLQTKEGPSLPFVFTTDPPVETDQHKNVLEAIYQRQNRYRQPREAVEKQILQRQSV